ncbi:MAG: tetratricopeptide repeat protein [Planctomycetes bacterium]|nr:tetratricopeptide repeat protein [Planctomycetota bacterium]
MKSLISGLLASLFVLASSVQAQFGEDDPAVRAAREAMAALGSGRQLQQDFAFTTSQRGWPEAEKVIREAVKEQDAALAGSRDDLQRVTTLFSSRVQQGRAVDHYLYGRILGLTGELEQAYAEFKRAINLDRYFFWAWDGLGVYHSNQRQWNAAVQNFEAALRIQPSFDKAAFGLAQALIQRGDTPRALTTLNELLARGGMPDEQTRTQAKLLLAEVYRTQGDHARALTELEAIERSGVRDFRVHAMKAFCSKMLERWDDALREYDKLMAIEPGEHRFLLAQGHCLQKLGRNADSANKIETYLSRNAGDIGKAERRQLEDTVVELRRRPAREDPQSQELDFDDWIKRLHNSPDVDKRRQAVMVLSKAPDPAPSAAMSRALMIAFARALEDSDPIVVAKSLEQLSLRYPWNDKVRDLARLFVEPKYDRKVRGMAAHCLKNWDSRQVVPDLILALQKETDAYVFGQIHDSLNTLTLAWIERILPMDVTPEVISRNRVAWNDWYRKNRDQFRKYESQQFVQVFK